MCPSPPNVFVTIRVTQIAHFRQTGFNLGASENEIVEIRVHQLQIAINQYRNGSFSSKIEL